MKYLILLAMFYVALPMCILATYAMVPIIFSIVLLVFAPIPTLMVVYRRTLRFKKPEVKYWSFDDYIIAILLGVLVEATLLSIYVGVRTLDFSWSFIAFFMGGAILAAMALVLILLGEEIGLFDEARSINFNHLTSV